MSDIQNFEVGDLVRTPRGLLARVTEGDSDGRLLHSYLLVGESALFPALVQGLDPAERRTAAAMFRTPSRQQLEDPDVEPGAMDQGEPE